MLKGNWSIDKSFAGNGLTINKAHFYHKKYNSKGNWWSLCGHFMRYKLPKTNDKISKCKICERILNKKK